MRIALPLVQNTGVVANRGGRTAELLETVGDLVRHWSPDLIVFPELSVSGYPGLVDPGVDGEVLTEFAEGIGGETAAAWSQAAASTGCALVFGMCERGGTGAAPFNATVWAAADGTLTAYRKIHLTPAESGFFTPGSRTVVAGSPWGAIGLSCCYDRMFPQIYQRQRGAGAVASVIASAWSSYEGLLSGDVWADHAEILDRARAVETGMMIVSTNYEGPKFPGAAEHFCGGQRVIDGLGRGIAPVHSAADAVVWDVDVDRSRAEVAELNDGDFFVRDARPFDGLPRGL